MYTSSDTSAVAPPAPVRRFQIRPLSTGEILDRTLSLYGSTFWFCAGAAAIYALITLISGASRVIYLQAKHLSPLTPIYSEIPLLLIVGFWSVVGLFAYGLSHSALTWGLASTYLGRPASLPAAFSVVRRHWLRYSGLTIMQLLVSGWPSLVGYGIFGALLLLMRSSGPIALAIGVIVGGLLAVASLPYSIYRYIQISLAMPACVLENLRIMASLRRSRELLPDRKGRVFVVLLLGGALYMALGMVVGGLALFELRGDGNFIVLQIITLLLTFVAALLLQPLFSAAFAILYYDERVRREGFDIQFMMSEGQLAGAGAGATSAGAGNGFAGGESAPGQGYGAPNPAYGQAGVSVQGGYAPAQGGYAPVSNAVTAAQTNPGA